MKRLLAALRRNYMIDTFLSLKGNGKACLWPEPLWGIPYNLYLPYVTLYMTALGLTPSQIGYISSITLISQVIFATLSGVLCDKLGRRKTTLIFDTLSWSIPEFIWMCAQDFRWFAAAALFNGAWRVTENSWGLLLIEDMPEDQVMTAFSLTQMLGLFSAFIAPLSKFAVDAFGLVPTMRVLYGITCISMTAKFIILYILSKETRAGLRRMQATRNRSMFSLIWECKDVFLKTVLSKRMLLTLGIVAIYSLVTTLNNTYWALYICRGLGVAESNVSLFTMLRSIITLACVLAIVPRMRRMTFRIPMYIGLALFMASQSLLLLARSGALLTPTLILCTMLEAAALSILSPVTNSLLFINADGEERARVCGLVYATISLAVSIFPGFVGQLAEISIRIPFFISVGLFALAAALTAVLSRMGAPEDAR